MAEAAHEVVTRGRPADPELESRFIQAAIDLMTEKGYRAMTTAAVAKRAGASTASLYRRWPSKRALVTDVARSLTLDALASIDTGTLEGDLRELICSKRRLLERVGSALLALLAEASHEDDLCVILRQEVVEATASHLAVLLDRAVARNEIDALTPGQVRMLSAVLVGSALVLQALPDPDARERDDIDVDVEAAMIMRAFAVRSFTSSAR